MPDTDGRNDSPHAGNIKNGFSVANLTFRLNMAPCIIENHYAVVMAIGASNGTFILVPDRNRRQMDSFLYFTRRLFYDGNFSHAATTLYADAGSMDI